VQEVETKRETPLMEAHELFVDVQYLILGEEKIFYTPKEGLGVQRPYSESGDAALYDFDEKSESVSYKSGEAIVLYPPEAHLPNRAVGEPMKIKKAIIKIAFSEAK
jgi:YhcH/YjgK/YiaL family protein